MTFKALGLPDWHIDCIHSIADACKDSRNDQLHALPCGCLQDSSNNHDPAAAHDTTLPTISIGSQECYNCACEAAEIIDGGDGTLKLSTWIVETCAKGWQANHGAKNTLVIAEKLLQIISLEPKIKLTLAMLIHLICGSCKVSTRYRGQKYSAVPSLMEKIGCNSQET